MYYIKCPYCGDVIEVGEPIDEFTCLECFKRYKVNKRNSFKAPPYDAYYIVALLIMSAGMIFTNALGNDPTAGDYISLALYALGALSLAIYADRLRKRVERAIKKKED